MSKRLIDIPPLTHEGLRCIERTVSHSIVEAARHIMVQAYHDDALVRRTGSHSLSLGLDDMDYLTVLVAELIKAKKQLEKQLLQLQSTGLPPIILVTTEAQKHALEQLLTQAKDEGGKDGQG